MYKLLNEIKLIKEEDLLLDGNWGLERETNRVYNEFLALTPHKEIFRKEKNITTDFSESQLEIITPIFNSIEKAYYCLEDINNYVKDFIFPEKMWPFSMPPILPDENLIPIAKYPDEPGGKEKEKYRIVLAEKYGKKMQMISGIHYNFSIGNEFMDFLYKNQKKYNNIKDFKSTIYLSISRNLFEYMWLIVYLFGYSPVCDRSYLDFENYNCDKFRNAISLRMSSCGYKNKTDLYSEVSFNSLEEYIEDLENLLNLDKKDKKRIISPNEFYSSLRIKPIKYENIDCLELLKENGIGYLEFRGFDLNPFNKNGISIEQMRFLHLIILFSIFKNCDYKSKKELQVYNNNMERVSLYGRSPCLELNKDGNKINIKIWAKSILNELREFAFNIDAITNSNYFDCVENQIFKVDNNEYLPSSIIYNNAKKSNSFIEYGLKLLNLEGKCCVL
jgi:glutamate--cysteine ligase